MRCCILGSNDSLTFLAMKFRSRLTVLVALGLLSGWLHAAETFGIFTPSARVLFQGDSITDGNRGRTDDPNHILGHGYQFILSARFGAQLAERRLIFLNRGVSGDTVLKLAQRWPTDTLELKPDVLSVLVGINDQSQGIGYQEFERTYDRLLRDAKAANPRLKFVLCEPFALPVRGYAEATVWSGVRHGLKKRQEIVAKLAKKYGAALVKFQRVFDEACQRAPAEHWIWDGIHPTYAGHQLMADEWTRTVEAQWPTAPAAP